MNVVPLGRSGIKTTEFLYGAGSIGGVGSPVATRGLGITADQGFERLIEAYELGIRGIDTADAYGGGESERTVGRWLSMHGTNDVLVQTKVGNVVEPDRVRVDLSARYIERQLSQSLTRLGCVDVCLSHAIDPETPIEETLTAFAAALQDGTIRAYGVSNVDAELLEAWLDGASRSGLPRPEIVQNGFNLLNRDDEHGLAGLIESEGLAYLAASPLAGGVLSDRYLDVAEPPPGSRIALAGDLQYPGMYSPANLARVARLRDLAGAAGISTAGLALAWLRHHPLVTAPIVSPSTDAQWQAVRDALTVPVDDQVLAEVSGIFSR
ncbi:aldo/keto reductase [Actinoplanes sp. TBRC 11911]|uniref:aldo/keto reductase n=1 Tax=Actinoplanes sp. TBRC 11911 TaxID=2729386 RepID=UPI00145EC50A|nr:aldo/keto reductase [Actinoplanes sp. TBRC 11911]NMO51093.1 aldo/keto reductase [Actinoplanes sp. TBRC 11911]